MYTGKKKKATNYGSIFVYCFFCLVLLGAVETEALFDMQKLGILPCNILRSSSPRIHQKLSVPVREETRTRPPVSYCVKFESFATMSKLVEENDGKYESQPFSAGGYNWTFLIYPNVDKPVGSGGYVSLYVKIDNSSFIANQNEVSAWIKFVVFKSTTNTWHELQATEAQRFHLFKQEYGQLNFLEIGYFQNPAYGFIFNGQQSVFGVDIVVSNPTQWEDVSYEENIRDPFHQFTLFPFSNRTISSYTYWFSSGGRNWKFTVYPNGVGSGMGNSLSLYLSSASNEKGYVKAKLRIIDQIRSNHFERQVAGWPNITEDGWGYDKFIPLADIKDASKGFLVDDTIKFEVELLSFSKTDSYYV